MSVEDFAATVSQYIYIYVRWMGADAYCPCFFGFFFALSEYTYWNIGYPTTYQTRHFSNNSKTNEGIATRFEQEYVRCVRNEKECACSVCLFRCNILICFRIIKEMPGLVGSGTLCIRQWNIACFVWLWNLENVFSCWREECWEGYCRLRGST
jgi:hypothetical protein